MSPLDYLCQEVAQFSTSFCLFNPLSFGKDWKPTADVQSSCLAQAIGLVSNSTHIAKIEAGHVTTIKTLTTWASCEEPRGDTNTRTSFYFATKRRTIFPRCKRMCSLPGVVVYIQGAWQLQTPHHTNIDLEGSSTSKNLKSQFNYNKVEWYMCQNLYNVTLFQEHFWTSWINRVLVRAHWPRKQINIAFFASPSEVNFKSTWVWVTSTQTMK